MLEEDRTPSDLGPDIVLFLLAETGKSYSQLGQAPEGQGCGGGGQEGGQEG